MLIDSHCHLNMLDLKLFNNNIKSVLDEAYQVGVTHFLSVCVSLSDVSDLKKLSNQYSQIFFSVGVHPTEEELINLDENLLINLADHPSCIAIGETGLDYARIIDNPDEIINQQERFRIHIRAAKAIKKPLIIHTRAAKEDTIRLLKEEGADQIGGVMHCFTEDWEMAQQALDLGFYISYSGIITFKNADLIREVAKQIPDDRLLVETDAPYLAPVPFRGKSNRPAWVRYTAEYLANLRQVSLEKLALDTTNNFYNCFKLVKS